MELYHHSIRAHLVACTGASACLLLMQLPFWMINMIPTAADLQVQTSFWKNLWRLGITEGAKANQVYNMEVVNLRPKGQATGWFQQPMMTGLWIGLLMALYFGLKKRGVRFDADGYLWDLATAFCALVAARLLFLF